MSKSKKVTSKKATSKTHGVFILDKSGSMAGLRQQVVTAFNEQVQQLRIIADTQPTFASLVTFNGDVFEVKWKEDIKTFPEATLEDYMPDGGTALHDAMGHTLKKLMDEDDGDTSYLIIVQSDGCTNSDRKFDAKDIKKLVEGCDETGRYTIVYIGCDEAVIEDVVRSYGMSASNTAKMSTADAGSYAYANSNISNAVHAYASMRCASPEQGATLNFCNASEGTADFTQENAVNTTTTTDPVNLLPNKDLLTNQTTVTWSVSP